MVIEKVYQQLSSKWCIKWVCSNCGHDAVDNVGFFKPTVSMDKEKKCPKCRSFGKDDYEKRVKARIEQLTEQRSMIDIEIDKLIRDLEPEKEKQ